MIHDSRKQRLLALLVLSVLPLQAMAQADCSKEIAEIEARMDSGNYPAYNVDMARQMLTSLAPMCGMMDESMKAEFLESFESVLPTKSEEERTAERRARSAEAKAARETRKRAALEAERNKPPVSPVLLAAPTARSVASNLYERDDIMHQFWTWDWDTYEGNLRVLYSTFPSRTQYSLPDWKFHVYVAEMTPGGEITHRLITSKQVNDNFGLALRRGYDEVLFHRKIYAPAQGGPATMERWSIPSQRMLSSVDISDLKPWSDADAWNPPSF